MAKQAAKNKQVEEAKALTMFYTFDANGVYIGPLEAETKPQNATDMPPPADGDDTHSAVFNGIEWRKFPNQVITQAIAARARRDALLHESDFSQLPDFGGDPSQWAEYRQGLRDVTKQSGFPLEIEWPAKPGVTTRPEPTQTEGEKMLINLNELVKELSARLDKVEKQKAMPVAAPQPPPETTPSDAGTADGSQTQK
jgi:hypothetical protein